MGILPAAGLANRLGYLPCSKEILHVDLDGRLQEGPGVQRGFRLRFNTMRRARTDTLHFGIRDDEWDIAGYWSEEKKSGLSLAYHIAGSSPGTPHSVNAVYPFVRGCIVALSQSRNTGMEVGAVTFDGGRLRDVGTLIEWRDGLIRSEERDIAAAGSPTA